MCGIFGAISSGKKFDGKDFETFLHATHLVSYRGIDAWGYSALDSSNSSINTSSFNIFLGHRRLSIIDLSENGKQPMQDEELYITYNGEVFNYLELRAELEKKGHCFKTNTDTEVILKVYREFGTKGFAKFNGMWAFALVDLRKKISIISRDRFSIKPLYYYKSGSSFYFASEIKQLICFLGKKEINKAVMYCFLQQGLLDYNDETFFEEIHKVKPMTNLIIDLQNGNLKEEKYWNYETEKTGDEKYTIERLRDLLYDSIRIRLRSDVPVGSLLSGGLDSSVTTVIANNILNGNFDSFSVVSHEKKYSEEKFIDVLVTERKIKNKKLFFQPEMILGSLDKVVYHQDEPFGSFSVLAQHLIFQKIKDETDIKVILSGQGGDEILMGYLKYFFFNINDLTREKKFLEAARQLLLSFIYRTVVWQFNFATAKRYIPSMAESKFGFLKIYFPTEKMWKYNNITERQMLDIDKFSVPALAHYEDRNSMAYSIESRLPFLDHRLVNFMLSVSTDLKLKDGWTKYILRKAFDELPHPIRWRRDKLGFITPEEKWMRTDLTNLIIKDFHKSVLDLMGIIDERKFLDYYDNFLNGTRSAHHSDIFRVFIAERWARKFLR